jgi:hypothetical protein
MLLNWFCYPVIVCGFFLIQMFYVNKIFWCRTLCKFFEDQEINGKVMLNWILGKLVVSCELDCTGSRSLCWICGVSYHGVVYLSSFIYLVGHLCPKNVNIIELLDNVACKCYNVTHKLFLLI